MSTERFTKQEFEEVLLRATAEEDLEILERGLVGSEWRYQIVANDLGTAGKVLIEIASSVGSSGVADATGENSIRLWLTDGKGLPLGSKISRWVTRVSGWDRRLEDQIDRMIGMAQAIQFCTKCRSLEKIFIVKKEGPNKGRLFVKCECPKSFTWLDESEEEEPPKSPPAVWLDEKGNKTTREAVVARMESENRYWAEQKNVYAQQEIAQDQAALMAKFQKEEQIAKSAYVEIVREKADETLEEKAQRMVKKVTCPKCGGMMKVMHRKKDSFPFLSCRMWPACDGTRNVEKSNPTPHDDSTAAQPPKVFTPSEYQKAIFDWVKNGDGHALVVEALAGSGKTTTGVEMLKLIPTDQEVAFVAFNKHIAVELQKRAPKHVNCTTYHSLGYAACRKTWGGEIQVNEGKVDAILETILDKYTYKNIFPTIRQIVSLVKANLTGTSPEELSAIAEYHGIEMNGDADTIFAAVSLVIERCAEMTSVVDFDDMCWLPVWHDIPCKKYDFLFIDEAQDTNKNQIALALKSVKDDGRIVAVGDRHQSLYGFRGADVDAIPNLIENLDAETLPLSITYRNPRNIVNLVNATFPSIPLKAADWAKDGVIRDISEERALMEFVHGDMVLCRTNAPLVGPAFALIRRGVKATIRGRDIGKGLVSLIRKTKASDLPDLLKKLAEYQEKEVAKLLAADKGSQAQSVQDKVETIVALADGVYSISELEDRVEMIFSDEVEGVVFSSVHRAKGLEAERVYILHPELMPHPMAKKPWEMVQESNVQYVAYTRTLSELIFVNGG